MYRSIKSISRRVALGLAETKRFAVLNEAASANSSVVSNSYYWMFKNVFSQLSQSGGQGVQSYQFLGTEIVNPFLKLKFTWGIPWGNIYNGSAANYQSVPLCVMLVSTGDDIATVPGFEPTINWTDTSDWFLNPDPYRVTMNGHNIRVLKKWSKMVHPDQTIAGTPQGAVVVKGRLTYRWKRKLRYQDVPLQGNPSRQNTLAGNNYYILVSWGTNVAVAGSSPVPYCRMDTFLYFKDP